jgi:hypothetical protein
VSPPNEDSLEALQIDPFTPKCNTADNPLRFTKHLQVTSKVISKRSQRCVHNTASGYLIPTPSGYAPPESPKTREKSRRKMDELGSRLLMILRACRDNQLKSFA